VTRAPTDRSHLSIGEVLSLLQEEFPDVTISKIRFLESQGLLDPERTPSGYRKFYESDIDTLRWILRQQKEHYLPLRVIKDRLEHARPSPEPTAEPEPAAGSANNGGLAATHREPTGAPHDHQARVAAVALDERPVAPPPAPAAAPEPLHGRAPRLGTATDRVSPAPAPGPAAPAATTAVGAPETADDPRPGARPAPPSAAATAAGAAAGPAPGSVSLTADELAQHSGLTVRDLRDLERYGLVESFAVGDVSYYDGDALVIAQTAAGFLQHGIEARHMRTYKVAVDREAGLFEQIVLPLLKQRNPEARQRARETVTELVRLGQQMRAVMLSRELRDVAGPA
jgi:DNA-binding transcriptional MerR regulator